MTLNDTVVTELTLTSSDTALIALDWMEALLEFGISPEDTASLVSCWMGKNGIG